MTLLRRLPLGLLALALGANLVVTSGAKGQGLGAGCFRQPLFSHHTGLVHLNDVVVFATSSPDSIQVYSVGQARMVNSIKAVDRLESMAVTPYGPRGEAAPRAYVVSKSGSLAAYDLRRNSIIQEIRLFADPDGTSGGVAVSHDGRYVVAGVGDQQYQIRTAQVRDTRDLSTLVAEIPFGGDMQELVANPARPELYIINNHSDKVRVFRFDTLTQTERPLDLDGSPSDVAISPDGRLLLASLNARHKLVFIDLETGRLFYEIDQLPGNPHAIAFSPDGEAAFVTERHVDGAIYRINIAAIRQAHASGAIDALDDRTVITTKRLPQLLVESAYVPEAIAVSTDKRFLYVTGSNNTHFAVINLVPIEAIAALDTLRYGFLEHAARVQADLTPKDRNDGLYEVQGTNLAKAPVTFAALPGTGLTFSFTSEAGKDKAERAAIGSDY